MLYYCRLNYSSTGYRDAEGVTVTAANFGNTSSVETLDLEDSDQYFFQFVDYFAQRGYTRDVNIRAAPYDYRLGASKLATCMHTIASSPGHTCSDMFT